MGDIEYLESIYTYKGKPFHVVMVDGWVLGIFWTPNALVVLGMELRLRLGCDNKGKPFHAVWYHDGVVGERILMKLCLT